MKILGIETSCDDTAAALIEARSPGYFRIIAERRSSQIDIHKQYGGVVPELAARAHAELVMPLITEVLAGKKPDVIAVTAGPGLITALMVGVQTAASLSYAWDVPLVAVNHIEGHIYGNWLAPKQKIVFPALALIVSGGHTELILMRDHGHYKLIGKTRDDAAGECFDKVGKLLGFEYPGGPKIAQEAAAGNAATISFPRPMINSPDFDFSFAGLKTAALYWLREYAQTVISSERSESRNLIGEIPRLRPDYVGTPLGMTLTRHFCASFEQAIVDVLVAKTLRAVKEYQPKTVLLGGGVAANTRLRTTLTKTVSTVYPKVALTLPPLFATVDNALMIAVAGYFHAKRTDFTSWKKISAQPNWRIA
ncbi:tRNA (adenosine(37)-N6)-threonylcarbamoyltransferase complex transferase subunit TsaD [Candidatus Uhrbacteria bacterium RIFCSPLOWO2_02_FULL_51_9]|uniref:tRNA N6-adenosine threonylcarbamoyltransferase n=1 Tax=Candidatus Uhrbacteria bacterium RIFCSPLOWO2_02_FULL_51_9 TaxID=1802410 RepID=A0A1F7VE59_9BACT|nr:MAG: tRNA (adenosine(37)-N6)-threonylcarbamoyltransferase complex transferase subunit TsaD [Candidatus Uhrbacteria bacterium RIFCSPLOWO2_02_FULL_51_9]